LTGVTSPLTNLEPRMLRVTTYRSPRGSFEP